MNSSQFISKVQTLLEKVDWDEVAVRTVVGLKLVWFAVQLLAMVAVILFEVAYENRERIKNGIVAVVAATIVAAELTYEAGRATRRLVLALSDRAAELSAHQPLTPLAPITAGLEALREALGRFVNRLYPRPLP